ncbi:LacI family transcriptional regulator [Pseudoruegeria sp. SK021]|uniref:LacI family transcriptional regulator n=1 Tax=Pseudoruegeria sp. SK021 TaxID=1933035 RepID=UPI00143DEDA9|nr:LacI family transcriptional regulator [Pseudoruegeria sp. SK021]
MTGDLSKLGGPGRPTLRTIAQIAELAVTTVSRALAGDPKIARATRERVQKIADQVGYVPDRAAQRLRTGKTRVVSLILGPHNEILGFGNSMITGLMRALDGTDYHLNVTPHFADRDANAPVEHIVRNSLADGLILSRTAPFDDRVRYLMEHRFPFVTHGRTEFAAAHPFVDFDNQAFAEIATDRLVAKGAKRICIILPPESFTFCQHLRTGLIRAAARHGVDHVVAKGITLDSSVADISAWVAAAVRRPNAPDGFICPGEASHIGLTNAMRAAGAERGRDYHVIVKASSDLLDQIDPGVDIIFEDIIAAGERMGHFLLKQIADPSTPPAHFIDAGPSR